MSNNLTNNDEIKNFHLPRWNELPNVDLYIDQVVCLLEDYLSKYIKDDTEKNEKVITKTMINNYVKHNVIKPPINKKYNKEHLAYLFVVFILKQLYSINEIKKLIELATKTTSPELSYNKFCDELEKSINFVFSSNNNVENSSLTEEQYILRNVVLSFANKLYVQKTFLSNGYNSQP